MDTIPYQIFSFQNTVTGKVSHSNQFQKKKKRPPTPKKNMVYPSDPMLAALLGIAYKIRQLCNKALLTLSLLSLFSVRLFTRVQMPYFVEETLTLCIVNTNSKVILTNYVSQCPPLWSILCVCVCVPNCWQANKAQSLWHWKKEVQEDCKFMLSGKDFWIPSTKGFESPGCFGKVSCLCWGSPMADFHYRNWEMLLP